jgi:hypothetical protein
VGVLTPPCREPQWMFLWEYEVNEVNEGRFCDTTDLPLPVKTEKRMASFLLQK